MVIDGMGADHKIDSLMNIGNIELDEQERNLINDWSNLKFLENTTIYDVQYPNKFNVLWKNFLVYAPRPENLDENHPGNFFEIFNNTKIDVNSSYDIGFIYEAVTYHLGFGQENSGKTMGLSAYGKYNKDLPRLIMDNGMANMNVFYSDKFLNTTNHPELRNCNREDLAWAIQKAMEYILILRVKQILKLKPDTKNIVFSGGCAMNICANTVMCEEFPDINFFIDPIAGDAGQSFGAAKYFYHQITQSMKKHPSTSVYYGQRREITRSQVEHEVAKINNVNYN
jgi:predicted NodU family carbamoyl transferase